MSFRSPGKLTRSPTGIMMKAPRRGSIVMDIGSEIASMRAAIRSYGRGIINPRTARWVQYWDAMSALCLLYTASVTPFEVCLLPSVALQDLLRSPNDFGLFAMNRLVDLFFTVDMCFNFFLAYQQPVHRGGMWITSLSKIRTNYLRTWFSIDLISILPFDFITRSSRDEEQSDVGLLRAFRFIRLVRLIKLLRILRASRIILRWQNFVGISYAQLTMIKFFTSSVFLVHFMACTWAYIGLNWEPSPGLTLEWETTWLQYYGFATAGGNRTHGMGADQELTIGAHRLYAVSLFVAVCSMFGSVGSIAPRNYAEYITITFMMLIGSMVWAWVIGSLCGILATLNPHATQFQARASPRAVPCNLPTRARTRTRTRPCCLRKRPGNVSVPYSFSLMFSLDLSARLRRHARHVRCTARRRALHVRTTVGAVVADCTRNIRA